MIIDVRLTSLRSSGGEDLSFPRAGVTCIVGGNNVGKSRILREIDAALRTYDAVAATFTDLVVEAPTIDLLTATTFLEEVGTRVSMPDGRPPEYSPPIGGANMSADAFLGNYTWSGATLQGAAAFFCWYASAGSLGGVASASVGMPGMNSGGQPLMRLFRDGALEGALSDISSSAFGVPLTLDRVNGNVQLRVGKPDIEVPPLDRPTVEYSDAVLHLPELSHQGDGIKTFLGLALTVLAGSAQILLIDEPEAFLHPAQARALGRWLGHEAVKRDIQVVLSTHDRDLLLGLIDADDEAVVNIVRLTRDGDKNHIRTLDSHEVAATWKNPVLRYSNVLQGLFHARAVIAESDADCRFYSAVLDQLGLEKHKRSVSDDLLFVPSGGKQRVGPMAVALSKLGVETYAIVDFDTLRLKADIRGIVESLGFSWTPEMDADYLIVARAGNKDSRWEQLKNQGISGLPSGEANAAGVRLISALRAARTFVVPVGEMEDFEKTIGLHGAAWVSEMLDQGNHKTCESARTLLTPLLA